MFLPTSAFEKPGERPCDTESSCTVRARARRTSGSGQRRHSCKWTLRGEIVVAHKPCSKCSRARLFVQRCISLQHHKKQNMSCMSSAQSLFVLNSNRCYCVEHMSRLTQDDRRLSQRSPLDLHRAALLLIKETLHPRRTPIDQSD